MPGNRLAKISLSVVFPSLLFAGGCRSSGGDASSQALDAGFAEAATEGSPDSSTATRDSTPLDPALTARLTAIRARVAILSSEVITFWRTKGPDPIHGGFYAELDRVGAKSTPTDKGIIQQSRHLWSFSNWYEHKEQTPVVRAIADGSYRFVVDHMLDSSDKQFYFTVNASGEAAVNTDKPLYAQSFAIFALSTYGRVFNVSEANVLALSTFRAIELRHDAAHLGYDEHNDMGGLGAGAQRSTNTHIHLMEAFTALYHATNDPDVRARLDELVTLVSTKLFQADKKFVAKEFGNDWSPVGDSRVSYGHDLETAWLLIDAAHAVGRESEPAVLSAAIGMGTTSANEGFDTALGGYWEEGIPGGAVTATDKIWWVESEALLGLLRLFILTRDPSMLDKVEATLTFIETKQRDNANPGTEWFWGIDKDGKVSAQGDRKGNLWKASYHNSRALTFAESWISEHLQ